MDATKIVSAEDAQKVVGILQNAGTQKLITAAGLLVVLLVASHFIVKLFKRFLNSTRLIRARRKPFLFCSIVADSVIAR